MATNVDSPRTPRAAPRLTVSQKELSQTSPSKIRHTNLAHVCSHISRYASRRLTCNRVPIYSLSSWVSIVNLTASMFVDPIRDVYEVRSGPIMYFQTLTFDRLSRC